MDRKTVLSVAEQQAVDHTALADSMSDAKFGDLLVPWAGVQPKSASGIPIPLTANTVL